MRSHHKILWINTDLGGELNLAVNETTGLVLALAQATVQLAGVIKRHVTTFSSLDTLASSIESKAIRVCSVAGQIRPLTQISGISGELFVHTVEDLQDVCDKLTSINQQIEAWQRTRMLIFRAPVIAKSLQDLDADLNRLDFYFRTIGTLGSMVSVQRTEMCELLISALVRFIGAAEHGDEARQILHEFECSLLTRETFDLSSETDADHAFILGLASYDTKPEKSRIVTTAAHKVRRAARYFNKACKLGKKEAFRYLGDVFYDGKGANRCYRTAVTFYEQGVDRNDPGAKFALGWCYEFGHGVDVIPSRAMDLYSLAVADGFGEAMANVGFLKLHAKLVTGNHREAARLLEKAVNLDVFLAKEPLAWCNDRGIGVDRDPVKAFELFKDSFYGGNLLTTVELANCYDNGCGVERNPWEATKVYEHCMNPGTSHGDVYKAYYGLRLIRGLGVEKDQPRGMALILDSTKSGLSWYALGECYRHGLGVKKDLIRAKDFYRNAVDCTSGIPGIVSAYVALGEMFEWGEGVVVDVRRAVKYYFKAAERLDPISQWKVAKAFESGVGFRKNVYRAVFYYEMCANSGHLEAQQKYITYYMKGHVIERSRVHAKEMIREAARSGNEQAKQYLRREMMRLKRIRTRNGSE